MKHWRARFKHWRQSYRIYFAHDERTVVEASQRANNKGGGTVYLAPGHYNFGRGPTVVHTLTLGDNVTLSGAQGGPQSNPLTWRQRMRVRWRLLVWQRHISPRVQRFRRWREDKDEWDELDEDERGQP